MKNIFVFYGEEPFLINKSILDIEAKYPHGQVIKYDLRETNINVLLEDASMISLFMMTKLL
jgi:DNA polymerase III delta subunit